MPIKEIITFGFFLMGGWFVTCGGLPGMLQQMRKVQIAIIKDVARTDNWGNPSIFQSEFSKSKKTTRTELRIRH